MGWSSSAPSGVSFSSSTKKTDEKRWNYYSAYPMNVWVARGTGNTYYVKVTVNWNEGQNGTYQRDNDGIYWYVGSDKQNFAMPSAKASQTKYYTGTRGAAGTVTVGVSPNSNLSNSAEVTSASIPAATYAVTYYANGGTGAPSAQTKTYGTALTLRTGIPARSGYNFVKWNTKADGTGTDYAAGGTYTANAALKLYAVWEVGYAIVLSSGSVSTPGTQVIDIVNGYDKSATVTVTDGNSHTLYSGTTDEGTVTVSIDKTWFDTAGVTTAQTFTATVTVAIDGNTLTETFTVVAGSDAFPDVGTPTITPVNSAPASTYYPTTFISGISRVHAAVAVTAPTNAAITAVTMRVGGETVTLQYNNISGKYEGTTVGTVAVGAGYFIMATDARGLSFGITAELYGILAYSVPVVNVEPSGTYRCDSNGDKDIKGQYYKAKAVADYTDSITGNALTDFYVRVHGGTKDADLVSGVQTAKLGGNLDPDHNETLEFIIQDKVSVAQTYTFILKAPAVAIRVQYDSLGKTTLDLPEGGQFMIGGVSLIDIIYPVGSVYKSSDSTSPATLFGGTWTQISSSPYYEWERTA